jgi:hypothetical protein
MYEKKGRELSDNLRVAIETRDFQTFPDLLNDPDLYLYLLDTCCAKTRRLRHNRIEIFKLLMGLKDDWLTHESPEAKFSRFHLAIKAGYVDLIKEFLELEDPICASRNISYLELAANYNQVAIYQLLLKKHMKLNNDIKQPKGFTVGQIKNALKTYVNHLKKQQILRGIFGSLMAIACPVGSILAFYELPFFEVAFSALIPGIGPFIGLAGALVLGGLLLWSMHNKSSLKYGAYGQKMAILDSTLAQIYRLKAELCQINEKLKTDLSEDNKQALNNKKEEIIEQLKIIRNNTEEVQPRSEARDEDWATTSDVLRTSMLTLGTFLCSFSGILAIMGTLVPYLPVIAATSVISAGIPIAGWIALGVCLVVGIGVAIWAYQTKYKNVLQNSGKARKELHEKQVTICQELKGLNNFGIFAQKDRERDSANSYPQGEPSNGYVFG